VEFAAVLLPPRRAESIARGYWHDRTINDYFDAAVAASPDKLALSAGRQDGDEPREFTYRQLATLADRIAVGLSRLGVGRNDIVAMQSPNWWQSAVLYLACSRIGAVLNPLMPIFRERELGFMLAHNEAKVLIVPKLFRNFDHEAMAKGLRPQLPALAHIVVIDGGGEDDFDTLLTKPEWEKQADASKILTANRPGADDINQLLYTSGTTSEPKGVMQSSNTLLSNVVRYAERLKLTKDDVILMSSPFAHQIGFMYGLMMPIVLGARMVMQDIWDPMKAIELIRQHGITFTFASTPFLTDLALTVAQTGLGVPSLKTFACGGAPIPGPLAEQARKTLGTKIASAWGMTENGAVTTTGYDDEDVLAFTTDGSPLPGTQIKIVDGEGKTLPPGETGRFLVRSSSNFGGYLKRPQWNNTDADGWFDTGDLAKMDAAGYIRITGRSKDVIIRGGENIPVAEVESLLYKHPAVAQVAIIGYPDERMGERACAVIVPKSGEIIDFATMTEFLKQQKITRQYIPERLILQESMPTTPSGKVQKFRLRQMLRDGEL